MFLYSKLCLYEGCCRIRRKSHSEGLGLMMSPWLYSAIDISRNTLLTEAWIRYVCFIFLATFTWAQNAFFLICFHVLHRYANELLSPLFMRVGASNTFDIICFLHLSTYQGTYYFLDGTGEWLTFGGYIWRLYWRRISNMYFYLSAFLPSKNGLQDKL